MNLVTQNAERIIIRVRARVCCAVLRVVMYLAHGTGHSYVNKATGVLNTLVCAALRVLLLLLGLDLQMKIWLAWSLR